MRDIEAVLNSYLLSVEKVIAFRPVARFWNSVKDIWGVQGSSNKPGLKNERRIPKRLADWWDRQISIWNGTPSRVDQALNQFADFLTTTFTKKQPTLRPFSNAFLRTWSHLNYLGALGFNPASALKNLTQNVPTIAEIGFKDWYSGLKDVMRQRTSDGMPEFHPLLKELGVLESSFIRTVADSIEAAVQNTGFKLYDGLNNAAFTMFQGSELLLRGTAGLGAYRKFRRLNKENYSSETKLHSDAVRFAKQIITRTQFDYGRILGPQAVSGQVGRLFGQFARFQLGMMDYLQLVVRRGLGNESAQRTAPLLPGDSYFISMMKAVAAPYILGATLFSALGVSVSDVETPFGSPPELPRFAATLAATSGAEILGAGPATVVEIRQKVLRPAGLESDFSSNIFSALFKTVGPAAGQIGAVAGFFSTDPDTRKRSVDDLMRTAVFPLPQRSKLVRYLKERRDGFVSSRASGNRLWPDRSITRAENAMRLLGLQPQGLAEELDLLRDQRTFEDHWASDRQALRLDALESLRSGTTPEEVVAQVLDDMRDLESDYHVSFSRNDVSGEISHIFKEFRRKTDRPFAERKQEEQPFKLITDDETRRLLGQE
jgi:hypothetical protein